MEKIRERMEPPYEFQAKDSIKIKTLIKGSTGSVFASSSFYIHDKDKNLNILYDTSFPYNSKKLLNALNELELSPDDIDYIILSHWHFDHCGSIEHFKNAKLIMSFETYRSIDYFDKAIEYSLTQAKPVDSLAEILHQKMNAHKKKAKEQSMINDNYKYFDKYNKVRAIANIIINNCKMYSHIIEKVKKNQAIIVNTRKMELSLSLRVFNLNVHTEGDLVLEIKNGKSLTYCIGDILEDDGSKEFENGSFHNSISTEDRMLMQYFFMPENTVINGHGKTFTVEKNEFSK